MIRPEQITKVYSLGKVLVRALEGVMLTISGTLAGRPIAGVGYLEMTGYAQPFRQPL